MTARPGVRVAVLIERRRAPNRWQDWAFEVADVVPDDGGFGDAPRTLHDDGTVQQRIFPGLPVELFRDEAEGYHLNLTSGEPSWFVSWRIDDADPSQAAPVLVTLSYNEAGRWMDAQERVDRRPLTPEVVQWLADYAAEHYKPEPKQRRRPQSFVSPEERRS